MGQAIGNFRIKYSYKVDGIDQTFVSILETKLDVIEDFPKADPDEVNQILSTVLASADEKSEIIDLMPELQMQLVFQHQQKLKQYLPRPIIPNEDALEELLKHLRELSQEDFESYVNKEDLINKLTQLLQNESEGDNDQECLILNIFCLTLQKIPNFKFTIETLYQMCCILSPYHIVNTCLILECFTSICWQSDEGVESIIKVFDQMKSDGKWKYGLEPLIKCLQTQKSVLAIGNVCTFMNSYIATHSNHEMQEQIKRELVSYGIQVLYSDVTEKIKSKYYQIKDCSYKSMIQNLSEQYQKYLNSGKTHYHKIFPPDDKPVELSICSNHSQELFIEADDPDGDEIFEDYLCKIQAQIDAFNHLLTQNQSDPIVEQNLLKKQVPEQTKQNKQFGRMSLFTDDGIIDLLQSELNRPPKISQQLVKENQSSTDISVDHMTSLYTKVRQAKTLEDIIKDQEMQFIRFMIFLIKFFRRNSILRSQYFFLINLSDV